MPCVSSRRRLAERGERIDRETSAGFDCRVAGFGLRDPRLRWRTYGRWQLGQLGEHTGNVGLRSALLDACEHRVGIVTGGVLDWADAHELFRIGLQPLEEISIARRRARGLPQRGHKRG